ncbi:MAG: NAD(P)H-dependent flavin oxidoreductase YrpB (nitropropane dioxygenase family) [Myxococcota bacterium]|jgi:NAD(P)H-dependent flavin oxidoreductase YrpB (nitropropane dioxygenase family)
MQTELCRRLGLAIPLFAFTRSREVVVAVSRAGGMGVLGVIATDLETLSADLDWIDANIDGKPYGVDVVIPAKHIGGAGGMGDPGDLQKMLPTAHRDFVSELLEQYNVPPLPAEVTAHEALKAWTDAASREQVELALRHPIKLIANALGPPPADIIDRCHAQGVLVAALIGSGRHATRQLAAGVDIIVAQGTEAGGHCGEISTFVLVPEVVDAVQGQAAVLAAGGIGSGRQMAAALALGAQGVWTGSIWLTTEESHTAEVLKKKLLAAGSRDTIRSRAISGKPARQLKTDWSAAWESKDNPDPLPMPLQFMLTAEAVARLHHSARQGIDSPLLTSPVGQIVGRMNAIRPAAEVVAEMVAECEETLSRLGKL